MITTKDIINKISENARYYFCISCNELPDTHKESVIALHEAIEIITSKIRLNKKTNMIIGKPPFVVTTNSGDLCFIPKEGVQHVSIDNFIYLDIDKLNSINYQLKIACILEELVHTLMNVSDESLTSQIVSLLYPGVCLDNKGRYVSI